jgi:hypothetical protein
MIDLNTGHMVIEFEDDSLIVASGVMREDTNIRITVDTFMPRNPPNTLPNTLDDELPGMKYVVYLNLDGTYQADRVDIRHNAPIEAKMADTRQTPERSMLGGS